MLLGLSLSGCSILNVQVVKQTVMTVVYGVTWVGGRLQVAVSCFLCTYWIQCSSEYSCTTLTSRPEGHLQPRELWFLTYSCTCCCVALLCIE